jgi:predicted secreted protein
MLSSTKMKQPGNKEVDRGAGGRLGWLFKKIVKGSDKLRLLHHKDDYVD